MIMEVFCHPKQRATQSFTISVEYAPEIRLKSKLRICRIRSELFDNVFGNVDYDFKKHSTGVPNQQFYASVFERESKYLYLGNQRDRLLTLLSFNPLARCCAPLSPI